MPRPSSLSDGDLASRLLGEAEDLAQAEARALAHALGGVERLEDPVNLPRLDAASRIGERHRDVGAGADGEARDALDRVDIDREPALPLHGVAGVHRHVHERRVELTGIGMHEAGLVRHRHHDLDAPPVRVATISLIAVTLVAALKISGLSACRRAKASSWPVSLAARATVSAIAST